MRGWRKHSVPDSNVDIQHIPKKSKDFKVVITLIMKIK